MTAGQTPGGEGMWFFKMVFLFGWIAVLAGLTSIHYGLGLVGAGASLMFIAYIIWEAEP